MPTLKGKPMIGEWIVSRNGTRGRVEYRSAGPYYSVWIRWPYRPDHPKITIVDHFAARMKVNGWVIES